MRKLILLFICFGLVISSLAISGCKQKATEEIKPAEVTKPATEEFVKPANAKAAKIMLDINDDGIILGATHQGHDLQYDPNEKKRMTDGNDAIKSLNPCRWVYTEAGWRCI